MEVWKMWYDVRGDISIFFSKIPDVEERFPQPGMAEEEIKEIIEKPFLNKKEFRVKLFNHKKNVHYKPFTIEKGYVWDGASIPKFVWSIVGANGNSEFLIPSLIHDKLCENKGFVDYDRYFSTCVFERLLRVGNVPATKRWLMKHAVDNFQKFQNWKKPKEEVEQCSNS